MMQIPVLVRDPIVMLVFSIGGGVAGLLIAWKLIRGKSK
jgi:hypothetical protein